MRLKELTEIKNTKVVAGSLNTRLNMNDIVTDTRVKTLKNKCFVALKGKNFNADDFLKDALKKGASAIVSGNLKRLKELENKGAALIYAKDTISFLHELSKIYINKLNPVKIMITGSCGKTTVKDFLNTLLPPRFNVWATKGNFNNLIGVPLTVLSAPPAARVLIIEAGTSFPGEIRKIAEIIKPDCLILTAIEKAHTKTLKNITAILKEKISAASYVKTKIIANGNNKYLFRALKNNPKTEFIIEKSVREQKNINARAYKILKLDFSGLKIKFLNTVFNLKIPGEHNALNFALSAAAAEFLNAPLTEIKKRASFLKLPPLRLEKTKKNKTILINDSYNANPASLKAGFAAADKYKGVKTAVLTDMSGLGKGTLKFHKEAVNLAQKVFDKIILSGKNYKKAVSFTRSKKIKFFDELTPELLKKAVQKELKDGLVYFKGSNDTGLHKIFASFKEII